MKPVTLVLLLLGVSCKGETLRVGGTPSDVDAGPTSGGRDEVWTGFLATTHFASGSGRVTLTLHEDNAGGVTGTAYFGEQPPLPLPTDPEIGNPVHISHPDTAFPVSQLDRFVFTVMHGTRIDGRILFDVAIDEIEKHWCEIQTTIYPFRDGGPSGPVVGYSCLPNAERGSRGGCPDDPDGSDTACWWNDETGSGCHLSDCGKIGLCMVGPRPCQCTATHCTVDLNNPAMGWLNVDLQLDGDTAADGIIRGLWFDPVNVRLHRQ